MVQTAAHVDDLVGRVISGRFRVVAEIARGGMGMVYEAEQLPLGRPVALKVLAPRYEGDGDVQFNERFFLEASVASRLLHINTVTIYDYGRTRDGIYFIAMELLRGRSLRSELKALGVLPAERVVHIASQIARSLREAHSAGVIHRDLKPANVMLIRRDEDDDFVKVLDFGLVKALDASLGGVATRTGLFLGSPRYMSPEQIGGEAQDVRSDVYSLGVVMYELLCGRRPFEGANEASVLIAHVSEPPPPLDCSAPESLIALVMQCLEKSPDCRPASMDEVLSRLKQIAAELGMSALSCATERGLRVPSIVPVSNSGVLPKGATAARPASSGAQSDPSSSEATTPPRGARRGLATLPFLLLLLGMMALAALLWTDPDAGLPFELPALRSVPFLGELTFGRRAAGEGPGRPGDGARDGVVTIRVTSDPSGAELHVNGRPYGRTPALVQLDRDEAPPGSTVLMQLDKDGYKSQFLERRVEVHRLNAHVKLVRARRFRSNSAGRPRISPRSPGDVGPP